jgi:hypothetical protein
LGPLHILAGGFVGKCLVQGQPFELANVVLIGGADAQVADPLAFGRLAPSTGPMCPNRLFNLRDNLYDNSEIDSITTLFRRASDVGLGYTQTRLSSAQLLNQFLHTLRTTFFTFVALPGTKYLSGCPSATIQENMIQTDDLHRHVRGHSLGFPAASPALEQFGYKFSTGGAHISRTMMVQEIGKVLANLLFRDSK